MTPIGLKMPDWPFPAAAVVRGTVRFVPELGHCPSGALLLLWGIKQTKLDPIRGR